MAVYASIHKSAIYIYEDLFYFGLNEPVAIRLN